jgi:hypothetical protein
MSGVEIISVPVQALAQFASALEAWFAYDCEVNATIAEFDGRTEYRVIVLHDANDLEPERAPVS